ncbi:MAG: KTSC domain-containing protein [Methanotrichaceae archaeon]|nr:KTSC domain-containing protein [Methanotrichaceae archaeon]
MIIERKAVKSSNVKSIGYYETTELLEVEFNNGNIYEYYKVPKGIYDSFMAASSQGKYLNQYIKGKYSFKKVS